MPRNMSFMLTTDQVRRRDKDVTRRLGWWFLKAGDVVTACVQCQGLKKGERIQRICPIRIISVRVEPLDLFHVTDDEVQREGFSGLSPVSFIQFFMDANRCRYAVPVNRIEFQYVCHRNSAKWCDGCLGCCG